MSRNTIRFSAFGILVWALFSLNIVLIAFAFFYESSWGWACTIIVSVVLFSARRIYAYNRRGHYVRSFKTSKRNRKPYSVPAGMPDRVHTPVAPDKQDVHFVLHVKRRAMIAGHQMLPGLPPICLN